ncbi:MULTISPECIES: alpha/beta hydrolase [Rhodobacterales]|uniref:alpha/beta hydrolase n=1 Tax=Rhodobacterales TaxID=204455 RepID=UPI000BBE20EC|nr:MULTISPECIES: alpha/beta hydrolase [Paracoccaceae]MCE6951494.1 alpha/beta hydrolase [Cereibacter sphaeroides]MCE6969915.1 alpha/beta hydrolase [Cereibacter sphaeroides]
MSTIYFASNRNVLHETSASGRIFGERFNAGGPQIFRVGKAEVAFAGGDPKDDRNWQLGQTRLFPESLDSRRTEGVRLGSKRLFDELRVALKENDRDVIVYIHGFANTFEETVLRAATLQEIYSSAEQQALVVVFSWPSNGRVQPAWDYFSDREDAEASGLAMGRALMRLVEFLTELRTEDRRVVLAARREGQVPEKSDLKQCTRRLHIMAHSMGNWALRHALRKFAELNGGRITRVVDCAFLMAADEDNDALHVPLKLRHLDDLANRVFVYHAANDVALTISDRTKGMPDRLGSDGPQNLDLVGERVFAIDCRHVSETEPLHGRHQYYRLRDEVIADIHATLADRPQDDRPGRETLRPGRSWRLSRA